MKRAALILLGLFWPVFTSAQVVTGTPPFGTFGGGPDVINLANLNSHLSIPVLNKAGRGTNFTYNLNIESSVWYPVTSGSSKSWEPNGFPGGFSSSAGYTTYSLVVYQCPNPAYPPTLPKTFNGHYETNYVFHDSYGVSHTFDILVENDVCQVTGPQQAVANDGSGYTMSVAPNGSATVTAKDGSLLDPPTASGTGAASMTDRNGNEITENSSGDIYDTLSATTPVLTITGSSPLKFNYTAPSGSGVSVTVNYVSKTVLTNFGCSGIAEFGPTAESLVSSISFPDGSEYQFTYEATPGHSGDVTGRLASITLPTGGEITYTYSGGSNGITCADGTAATLTRAVNPGGTWTYAHTESGTAWTTTVTDPQGDQSIYNFQGIYQTERQVKQDVSGTQTLKETVYTCYNGVAPNCNSTAVTLPITAQATYNQWPSDLESETKVFYDATYGLPTEEDDYDYGTGSPGSLLRQILVTYASLGNGIVDQPATVKIENSAGTVIGETTYTYDQGTPTALSNTPQHVTVSGSRGNPTTIEQFVTGSTYLTRTFTYYDTGNVDVATDVNGAHTTYNYANATSTCGNAFPTSVTEAIAGLSQSMAWNCNGGVMTSLTDENSKTTTYTYNDPYFWRTNAVTDPESYVTNFTYSLNPTSMESSLVFNSDSSTVDALVTLDGLGRTLVSQQRQSPSSSSLDSVETDYDSLGRPSRSTVPYSGTSGETNSSAPATDTTYDALSRPTEIEDGGGGTISYSYTSNDVLQTVGPAPGVENPKRRQSEYNGLGELTSVCELTSASGDVTCGQTTTQTGYWTKYAYDPLGDLTGVTQDALSSTVQTRSYTFDDLGRMTSETNPETGSKYYFYDTDPKTMGGANCTGTYDGDLVKIVDAAGNVTCLTYDGLHRVTSVTYPYGPNSDSTPSKYFVYDSATVDSVAMANAKSRLAEAYTCVSPCTSKITDEGFSYTARGEVATAYESTPNSGGYFVATATYWANGLLDELTAATGYDSNYGVDGEGRIYSTANGAGLASTSYNVASQPTSINFASGDSDSFTYDPDTFRMTQYKYNVNGQSVVGNLTWNANGTLGSLAITDPFNSGNTQTCTYSYDDLARIASGNCGAGFSDTYSYDAFGNLTKTGTFTFQPGYNHLANQMSSGASYDLNGDVLSDSLNSYAWDTNGRPTTINSVTATYDALGRMVEQNRGGSYTQIQYSPTGFKMQLMNGQSYAKAWVPMPAGTAEVWQASGSAIYYQHADWLGSERFESTTSRTMYNDLAYTPFGEPYAQSGSGDISFTGVNQDTSPNVYDAMYREYGVQGRWPSPDPAGMAAVNPANPQSWNRYAYVLNNPNLFTDPLGLVDCPPGTEGIGSSGTCVVVTVPGIYWGEITDIGGPSGGPLAPPINFLGFGGLNELPLGGYHSLEALEPQSQAQQNACTQPILNAVSNQFGPGTYSVTNTFPQGGGTDLQITATNLTASQFNALQTGRYPLNWWTYAIGYGPTLHVTGATLFDPNAYFSNSNIGGVTSVDFTAHIDTSFAYNPIGALIHLFRDLLHIGGPRNPCP